MKIEEYTKAIQKKLGKEEASKIADDIASIITHDAENIKLIEDHKKEIEELKKDKEMLITANGNLLQKVSMEKEEVLNPKKEDNENKKREPFDMRSVFDEKGRFIK